jgi:hypothetical protein
VSAFGTLLRCVYSMQAQRIAVRIICESPGAQLGIHDLMRSKGEGRAWRMISSGLNQVKVGL